MFALEGIDGAAYRLNMPTIIGFLLNMRQTPILARDIRRAALFMWANCLLTSALLLDFNRLSAFKILTR